MRCTSLVRALTFVALAAACAPEGELVVDSATDATPGVKCGDGQQGMGEACDDDNDDPRDGCTNECTLPACGDGVIQNDETCDDGNDVEDDACTASCSAGPAAVASFATGGSHTCASSTAGAVRCWGAPGDGRLGQPGYDDTIGDDEPPSDWDPLELGPDVEAVYAGSGHSCVRRANGAILCWGNNDNGQLGYGHNMDVGDDEPPNEFGDLPLTNVVDIAIGTSHTCALNDAGEIRCWGYNNAGQLGYGDTMLRGDDETIAALPAVALPQPAVEVVAGENHTCARLQSGEAVCWGRADGGQLGYGNLDGIGDDEPADAAGPVPVGGKVIDIDTHYNHTCAVLEGGTVRCWGANNSGQLGTGDTKAVGERKTPAEVGDIALDDEAIAVEVGNSHTCVLTSTGKVRCWGYYLVHGVPGTSSYDDIYMPGAAVHIAPVQRISSGSHFMCAVLDTGGLQCWGGNDGSVLGYPGSSSVDDPDAAGDVDVF